MKKLFDLKECSESQPMDPGPGSSVEEVRDYQNAFNAWLTQCQAELNPKYPTMTPEVINTLLIDNKGFVWVRNVLFNRVELKLDLLYSDKGVHINRDTAIIVALQVQFGDYAVLTLSKEGIKKHTIALNKVRVARLLAAMCDHANVETENWYNQVHKNEALHS